MSYFQDGTNEYCDYINLLVYLLGSYGSIQGMIEAGRFIYLFSGHEVPIDSWSQVTRQSERGFFPFWVQCSSSQIFPHCDHKIFPSGTTAQLFCLTRLLKMADKGAWHQLRVNFLALNVVEKSSS